MKNLKKLFAVILSLAMVLGMSITTFAASPGSDGKYGTSDDTGTITVTGIEEGATVKAYKVIEAKYENNGSSFSGYNSLYPNVISNADLQNLDLSSDDLKALADAVNFNESAVAISMTYEDGKYKATVAPGTYLVLVTDAETNIYNPMVVSVYYKNVDGSNNLEEGTLEIVEGGAQAKVSSQPSVDKVITNNPLNGNKKGNSVNIGDDVEYQVSVNPVPNYNGSYPVLNVVDTLSKGLSLNDGLTVVVKGAGENGTDVTLTRDTDYTFATVNNETGETVITVNFVVNGKYTLNDYAGKEFVITYSAKLNDEAELNENANINDVVLNYTRDSKTEGNDDTDEDKTYTYTFDIDGSATGTTGVINKKGDKTEDTDGLNGAEFALYKANQLKEDGTFEGDPFKTTTSSTEGEVMGQLHFTGLEAGTYYLQETKAPDGYSVNTTIFKVVITANYNDDGTLKDWSVAVGEGVDSTPTTAATFTINSDGQTPTTTITGHDIMNTTLSSLPSTGGIGTTIFTIAGCVIMIVAAGLFFASRKKRA